MAFDFQVHDPRNVFILENGMIVVDGKYRYKVIDINENTLMIVHATWYMRVSAKVWSLSQKIKWSLIEKYYDLMEKIADVVQR